MFMFTFASTGHDYLMNTTASQITGLCSCAECNEGSVKHVGMSQEAMGLADTYLLQCTL